MSERSAVAGPRVGRRASAAALGGVLCLCATRVSAHPSPAEPPSFFSDNCVVVLDKRERSRWNVSYAVLTDDTAPEPDHITLLDSKTHQFFAVSGNVFSRQGELVFVAADDEAGEPRGMPSWLTEADVARAAMAAADDVDFSAAQVEESDILEHDPRLSAAIRPLVGGTHRVPITEAQAVAGVDWDLTEVPAGSYQIVAYIFSPPYNGWAVRPGKVKVVEDDTGAETPAVTLEPMAARLFGGQGRRAAGCVQAPAGSTLQLSLRPQRDPPPEFEAWVTADVGRGDNYELCLGNPGVDAVMEVRAEVRTPAGLLATAYSGDVVSMLSTPAACRDSALICCDATSDADAGAAIDPPAMPPDAAPVFPDAEAPRHDAAIAPPTESPAASDAGEREEDAANSTPFRAQNRDASSGCRLASNAPRNHGAYLDLALCVAAMLWIRRRRGHSRTRFG